MDNQIVILNNKINDLEIRVRKLEFSLSETFKEFKKLKGHNIKLARSLKNINDDIDYRQEKSNE
jgi:hypothetical protein